MRNLRPHEFTHQRRNLVGFGIEREMPRVAAFKVSNG